METHLDDQLPLYAHDCDTCVYLGRNTYQLMARTEKTTADVYFCQGSQNHIGEEACILVRWQNGPFSFAYFPYFIFYLRRYDKENNGNQTLFQPYLWGLEQAQKRGLLKTS